MILVRRSFYFASVAIEENSVYDLCSIGEWGLFVKGSREETTCYICRAEGLGMAEICCWLKDESSHGAFVLYLGLMK